MDFFGSRLKQIIKESDYKFAKAFAEKIGYTENSVSLLIQGKTKPSYDFIQACLDVFPEEKIYWLLFGKNHRDSLELENEKLRHENSFLTKRLREVKKPLSDRIKNPRPSEQLELVYA